MDMSKALAPGFVAHIEETEELVSGRLVNVSASWFGICKTEESTSGWLLDVSTLSFSILEKD